MKQMDATAEQVQRIKRRLVEASAEPHLKRLQLMTMAKAPQRSELLDALIMASTHPTNVEPLQRVYQCWERWMLAMHEHESFGTYARRNMRGRP